MTSTMVKAATLLLRGERRRKVRPLLTEEERTELALDLTAIAAVAPFTIETARARRGEAAVELFGYKDTFYEAAANVVTDIMHAAQEKGADPLTMLAHARAYFYEERIDLLDTNDEESAG